jgi:hypothetical protein
MMLEFLKRDFSKSTAFFSKEENLIVKLEMNEVFIHTFVNFFQKNK